MQSLREEQCDKYCILPRVDEEKPMKYPSLARAVVTPSCAATLSMLCGTSTAQSYPTRPVRILVGFARLMDYFDAPSLGTASTGSSNAMKSTQGVALLHSALCGKRAGPYAYEPGLSTAVLCPSYVT